jgi:hypothetical protein
MIDEPGHSSGHLSIPFERGDDHVEDNFRCVARSLRRRRTRHGGWFRHDREALAAKAAQVKKADAQVKSKALKANAKMGRHHAKHVRHHRAHKKVSAVKTHQSSKATIKQAPATKRG